MKKFIVKILLFILIIIGIDVLFGPIFGYMRSFAQGGSTYKNQYIMEKCCDDIIILGASRACNHYIPSIIEDSLQLSCYNCGESGNGVIAAYARYCSISERHIPKLVIYDCLPNYDCYYSDPYSIFLWSLRPYSYKSCVKELFYDFADRKESLKLCSNMYKNNSKLLLYLSDCIKTNDGNQGYLPHYGIMSPLKEDEIGCNSKSTREIDSLKVKYLRKLFKKIKADGAFLFCVAGPYYLGIYGVDHSPIINMCAEMDIPFFDFRNMNGISDNSRLFKNSGHLNSDGAEEYTRRIISIMRGGLTMGE